MVGSAATHRQLRKVLVRNGLLDNRASVGPEQAGANTAITDSDTSTGFNILSDLFPSVTYFDTSSTRSSSLASSSITSVASVTLSTTTTSSSSQTLATSASSSPSLVSSSSTTSPSSTAGASKSTSAGNLIGGVAAGLIAVIALCVFGFFILRRRRQRGNELKRLHQVDPFTMGHSRPDMSEQRMTFGTLYGRPGSSYQEEQKTPVTPYPYAPQSTLHPIRTRSGSLNLASPFANPAPYLNSPVSPNGSSLFPEREDDASPFADFTGDGSLNPILQSSLIIQAPPSAAVKHSPSRNHSAGFEDELAIMSASGYSPMVRRSLGTQGFPVPSKDGTRPHNFL